MFLIELFKQDYTLRIVALASALLGIVSGAVGSFAILKKEGLLADAVSHAALPGIAITFILIQTKSTLLFMVGALIAGLLAVGFISLIEKNTRIKIDSAMALVLSVFFGFGLVLLTYIQKIPNSNQAGLEKFIFGQAATMLKQDVYYILAVGIVLLILIIVFWKEFKIVTFDIEFADSIGISSKKVSVLLSSMIVLSIIIGLQTVGVILMSAMLVAPGVAARQWTNRLHLMVILAGLFGGSSGVIGTLISSIIPQMPTGPSIVIIMSIFVVISLLCAPNRGLLWKWVRDLKQQHEITEDMIMFNLYDLARNHKNIYISHPIDTIKPIKINRKSGNRNLSQILHVLEDKGYVVREYFDQWALTDQGITYVKDHSLRKEENDECTN